MTTVADPRTGVQRLVVTCRSCGAEMYFGVTAKGRRCPFDIQDGEPTETSHFTSCPQARAWSRKAQP